MEATAALERSLSCAVCIGYDPIDIEIVTVYMRESRTSRSVTYTVSKEVG